MLDAEDGFPRISLAGRLDTDEDGFPDECDEACVATGMLADVDDDNDGVTDDVDAFPLDATESSDRDGDGVGDKLMSFRMMPTKRSTMTRMALAVLVITALQSRIVINLIMMATA